MHRVEPSWLIVGVCSLAAVGCNTSLVDAEQLGTRVSFVTTGWQSSDSMPQERTLRSATLLPGNKVFIAGGWSRNHYCNSSGMSYFP